MDDQPRPRPRRRHGHHLVRADGRAVAPQEVDGSFRVIASEGDGFELEEVSARRQWGLIHRGARLPAGSPRLVGVSSAQVLTTK